MDIIDEILSAKQTNEQFSEQLERVTKAYGNYPENIKITVEKAIDKIVKEQVKSFIICGEPQGGKTEMMICLSAKILDEGYKTIIILLNDDVNLLQQNLKRFETSAINPAPITCNIKKSENEVALKQIGDRPHIIFCKKNTSDMKALKEILPKNTSLIIIDDEADYASPDSNVNKDTDPTRINSHIDELLKRNADNIYVGVTATPARLDLNDTFKNDPRNWIYFEPNEKYCGRNVFFPADNSKINFSLCLTTEAQDEDASLKKALLRFIVNVANLNTIREEDKNYYMLVHTSGKVDKHDEDEKRIIKIFHKILSLSEEGTRRKVFEKIKKIIEDEYSNDEQVIKRILEYVRDNIARHNIIIANHTKEKTIAENMSSPTTPFSILIGGNVVSRGATFNNLLAMFFYRDVKNKIQSDTFIQRARMFGVRNNYLSDFELTIPEDLYKKWRRCFIFYGLSIEQIKNGELPIWYKDDKINAAANASIKKFNEEGESFIDMDKGEVMFDKFKFTPEIEKMIANSGSDGLATLNELKKILPSEEQSAVPISLINFINQTLKMNSQNSQNVHFHQKSLSIATQKADQEKISRHDNFVFFSGPTLTKWRSEGKYHVLRIFYNKERMARLAYKFNDEGKVRSIKRKINNQENQE